jgi:hypothetical protein
MDPSSVSKTNASGTTPRSPGPIGGPEAGCSIRPQDIVIRPSTVWNTRAPYHNLFELQKLLTQTHAVTTMALESLAGRELRNLSQEELKGKLATSGSTLSAWKSWRKSFAKSLRDAGGPSGRDLAEAVVPMQRTLRHAILTSYISAFDHYVVSWSLNYLLARLEVGLGWTRRERWLAHELSPLGHKGCDCKRTRNVGYRPYGVRFPETAKILESVGVAEILSKMPALEGTTKGESASRTQVSAWVALEFWKHFRNHVEHKGARLTRGLAADRAIWSELLRCVSATGRIEQGAPLPAPQRLLPACFGAHNRVARWLQDFLIEKSGGRRGHYYSPGPRKPLGVEIPVGAPKPRPLLIEGDHEASWDWVRERRPIASSAL